MSYPYYRRYPSDLYGDARVQLMRPLAKLAYGAMLDISWQLGPLKDPEAVVEALGVDRDHWADIRPCWTETKAGWIQERLEAERAYVADRMEASARASEASARARAKRAASGRSAPGERPVSARSASAQAPGKRTAS